MDIPELTSTQLFYLFAMIASQVADVMTTLGFLKRGGVEENGGVSRLMNLPDRVWIPIKLIVTTAFTVPAIINGNDWVVGLVTGATAAIAWHNTKVNA